MAWGEPMKPPPPERASELAAAGVTVTEFELPVIVAVVVSMAVSRCPLDATVLSAAETVFTPASAVVKEVAAGRVAWPSVLVNRTVPVYPVAVLP